VASHRNLLCLGNPKTAKGESLGYLTGIMHFAPCTLSGYNVCPKASKGCKLVCLNKAGRGQMTKIQEARIRKTKLFFEHRDSFMADLVLSIKALIRKAKREGFTPAVRLNGTSDIRWERVPVFGKANIMELFSDVQFYDYTALTNRRNIPANYHLTFSRKESNDDDVMAALEAGMNVAAVFDKLPETWAGERVIDGTEHDLRFLDPKGCIVGLLPKGPAKHDDSGFVIRGACD
jgi:hypothetical protein